MRIYYFVLLKVCKFLSTINKLNILGVQIPENYIKLFINEIKLLHMYIFFFRQTKIQTEVFDFTGIHRKLMECYSQLEVQ